MKMRIVLCRCTTLLAAILLSLSCTAWGAVGGMSESDTLAAAQVATE